MFDDFLLRACLAGIGIALVSAPLGCFVVWRKMAYFSDATAHAAILGVALSLAFSTSIVAGAIIVSLTMALLVNALSGRGYAIDTLLGVLAHSALAFGLVAASFLQGVRIDLMAYLFGDILAISKLDLGVIWTFSLAVLAMLAWRWSALLTSTLNPDLAHASGIDPRREQLILIVSLAITVAVAIKVFGVLLIGALLIIPAASARAFSRTPEAMVVFSALIGIASTILGLAASWNYDTPAGPSIVCSAALLFALSNVVGALRST